MKFVKSLIFFETTLGGPTQVGCNCNNHVILPLRFLIIYRVLDKRFGQIGNNIKLLSSLLHLCGV